MLEEFLYSNDPNIVLLKAAIYKLVLSMFALALITFWLAWLDQRLGIDFKRHVWPSMRDNPSLYMASRFLGACILVGLMMSA